MSSFQISQSNTSGGSTVTNQAALALSDAIFDYKMVPGSPKLIQIVPTNLGNGQEEIRIPFNLATPMVYRTSNPASIDTATTGLGAIVDGASVVASNDYLLWAFHDGTNFIGYGATRLPTATVTYDSGGGTFGTTSVFTVDSGDGYLFNVGARVKIRQGTNPGDDYNQGVIIARTDVSVTVELDNDYASPSESNADISTIVTGQMVQLSKFAPLVDTDGDPYGGYYYAYLGSVYVDFASNIASMRKRGDDYWFDGLPAIYERSDTSGQAIQTCLARYLPFGVRTDVLLRLSTSGVGISKKVIVTQNQGGQAYLDTSQDGAASIDIIHNANGRISTLPTDQSIYIEAVRDGGGVGTTLWQVYLNGYVEHEF